jgi:hypothetical protein
MITTFKAPILALTLALSAAPAFAQQSVELVTGIGFGSNQVVATQNAVRAWVREGQRLYGTADFNSALRTGIDCNYTDPNAGGGSGITPFGVQIEGDATQPWACSVTGLPLSAIQG